MIPGTTYPSRLVTMLEAQSSPEPYSPARSLPGPRRRQGAQDFGCRTRPGAELAADSRTRTRAATINDYGASAPSARPARLGNPNAQRHRTTRRKKKRRARSGGRPGGAAAAVEIPGGSPPRNISRRAPRCLRHPADLRRINGLTVVAFVALHVGTVMWRFRPSGMPSLLGLRAGRASCQGSRRAAAGHAVEQRGDGLGVIRGRPASAVEAWRRVAFVGERNAILRSRRRGPITIDRRVSVGGAMCVSAPVHGHSHDGAASTRSSKSSPGGMGTVTRGPNGQSDSSADRNEAVPTREAGTSAVRGRGAALAASTREHRPNFDFEPSAASVHHPQYIDGGSLVETWSGTNKSAAAGRDLSVQSQRVCATCSTYSRFGHRAPRGASNIMMTREGTGR